MRLQRLRSKRVRQLRADAEEERDVEVVVPGAAGVIFLASAMRDLSVRLLHAGRARSRRRSQCLKKRSRALSVTLKLKGRWKVSRLAQSVLASANIKMPLLVIFLEAGSLRLANRVA